MLDHTQVRRLLRQRHPMLLLDRVTAVRPPSMIVAVKAVTAAEPCYAYVDDGSPDFEYPLALLVESFGQAVSVLWSLSGADRNRVPLLASMRDVVVESAALPGDVLEHEVRLDHVSGDTATFTGRTRSAGRPVLSVGSMLVVARPSDSLLPDRPAAQANREIPT